ADNKKIRNIFLYEGRMIAFLGAILGIMIGSALCFLQEHFGLLKLGGGGNYIIDAYPVDLMFKDIILVFITVLVVSIPSTWWPVLAYFKKEENTEV
ncbi:MAG: FtsX-like permease family protein, partial [Bacteroidales bacterium]